MPRGNPNNPFCLFSGKIPAPQTKAGDWIEVLYVLSGSYNTKDLAGQKVQIQKGYMGPMNHHHLLVQRQDTRQMCYLMWGRGDRWRRTEAPK